MKPVNGFWNMCSLKASKTWETKADDIPSNYCCFDRAESTLHSAATIRRLPQHCKFKWKMYSCNAKSLVISLPLYIFSVQRKSPAAKPLTWDINTDPIAALSESDNRKSSSLRMPLPNICSGFEEGKRVHNKQNAWDILRF